MVNFVSKDFEFEIVGCFGFSLFVCLFFQNMTFSVTRNIENYHRDCSAF